MLWKINVLSASVTWLTLQTKEAKLEIYFATSRVLQSITIEFIPKSRQQDNANVAKR